MIKRYVVDWEQELLNEFEDGPICYLEDIDPILKAARILAIEWHAPHSNPDCLCIACQAARLIIEKTEGLE